jgi:hypothetical protein
MCSSNNSSSNERCLFKSSSAPYLPTFSFCGFSKKPTLLFLKKLEIMLAFRLLKDAADKT